MRNLGFTKKGSSWLAGVAVLGLGASTMLAGTAANAVTISLGTAGVYAVAAPATGTINIGGGSPKSGIVNGNAYAKTTAIVKDGGKINGTLFKLAATSVTVGGSPVGIITGGQVTLSNAVGATIKSDLNTAVSNIAGLTATQTFGDIKNTTVITGTTAQNVINIKSINLTDAKTLTFTGTGTFIVRVSGAVTVDKTAKIIAATGPTNVLVTVKDTFTQKGTGTTVDGTYISLSKDMHVKGDAGLNTLNGALLLNAGGTIRIQSGNKVNFVGFVPEPGVLSLLSLGLGGLGLMGRKRTV